MGGTRRPGFSDFEKAEIWRCWKSGKTFNNIGRVLGRAGPHVRSLVAANGGIVPAPRRRSVRVLSRVEREEISRGVAAGDSMRSIATALKRAPSTVSREIARHGGREAYRADAADKSAWAYARRPKYCRLATNRRLQSIVVKKLRLQWSPEQISGWLKEEYPEALDMQLSHETIYRSLFIQARGVLKKELQEHLRTRRTLRRSRHATLRKQSRGQIVDAISISERPAEVEDRAIPGHWEGDLIAGINKSYIATLVERHSRFVMLVKVDGKSSPAVVQALIKQVRHLPRKAAPPGARLRRSHLRWSAPGAAGVAGRPEQTTGPAAQCAPGPRQARPDHSRPDLPWRQRGQCEVGLIGCPGLPGHFLDRLADGFVIASGAVALAGEYAG